jgi:putative solute:sodium symporter small subunit
VYWHGQEAMFASTPCSRRLHSPEWGHSGYAIAVVAGRFSERRGWAKNYLLLYTVHFAGESRLLQGGTMSREERAKAYWKANQRLIFTLLAIWFVVAYIPPLFIEQFNQIVFFGFPFGYYMGSQGSLIVFVVLIFYYAFAMNRLDQKYGLKDKDK